MDDWERCRLPDDLPFEGWVDFVFDHPVLNPQWWWQEPESGYYQDWNEEADLARTLRYLTELFSSPKELISRFSRAQIDQGLNYLVSSSCSNHMFVLSNSDLPLSGRLSCIRSMIPLYKDLIAPVYQNDIGHNRWTANLAKPTFACYMWWDIIPLYGSMGLPEQAEINDAVLHVFERTLRLKSEACLESVLHGLGHWHHDAPKRTEDIIRQFLRRTDISKPLRAYAECAAKGMVQ